MAKTKGAFQILDGITGNDPELKQLIEQETINAQVAGVIYEARTRAGFTQQELSDLVGTKPSVIARLEDADYEGDSLAMLQRIAAPLYQQLEIRRVPAGESLHTSLGPTSTPSRPTQELNETDRPQAGAHRR